MAQQLITGTTTPGASVTVYWANTTTKPTINVSDGGAAASNPITADANNGSYAFWIGDGHYTLVNGLATGSNRDLKVKVGGQPGKLNLSDVLMLPHLNSTETNLETFTEKLLNGGVSFVGGSFTGPITTTSTTTSGSISTGSIITAGGVGIAKTLYVGETGNFAGQLAAAATTQSTTALTGALICSGGFGLAKNMFTLGSINEVTANGANLAITSASEEITLSTSGTTTDSTANLLPAGSIILGVVARITETITTATDWKLGDPTTAARFAPANATLVAGTTSVGLDHWSGAVSTLPTGPSQAAAAKLRITTTGTPGAGKIRATVYALTFTAPTS